jgi:hypothetical protein
VRVRKSSFGRNAHSTQCRLQPPALLLAYLPSLTAAACRLLDRFLSDPTAYGVSLAFAESEQQLEEAFLPWCGVIGSAFASPSRSRSTGSIGPRKLIKQASKQISAFEKWKSPEILDTDSISPSPTRGGSNANANAMTKVFRRLSWGSSSSRSTSRNNSSTGSPISDSTHSSDYCTSSHLSRSNTIGSPLSAFQHSKSEELPCDAHRQNNLYPHDSRQYLSRLEVNRSREPSRISSFRDLAILPTQRVMRYVLLFRGADSQSVASTYQLPHQPVTDLLANTPETCCDRPVIEEALAAATRVAEKCDRAQRNTAFVRCD